MVGYWPSSFLAYLWTKTESRSKKWQKKKKRTRPIPSHLDRPNLVSQQGRQLHRARSGGQSECRISFILPANGASHIIKREHLSRYIGRRSPRENEPLGGRAPGRTNPREKRPPTGDGTLCTAHVQERQKPLQKQQKDLKFNCYKKSKKPIPTRGIVYKQFYKRKKDTKYKQRKRTAARGHACRQI